MTKRLRWPIRFNNNTHTNNTVVQDSNEDILMCAENVLRTIKGSRICDPNYGVEDKTFEMGTIDGSHLIEALEYGEPRAIALIDTIEFENMITRIGIRISS